MRGKKACSKPKQKSFFLFAEWPKFLENKQVLPSYNAILMVPFYCVETAIDSHELTLSYQSGKAASETSVSKYNHRQVVAPTYSYVVLDIWKSKYQSLPPPHMQH